jgi:hypothetical protein
MTGCARDMCAKRSAATGDGITTLLNTAQMGTVGRWRTAKATTTCPLPRMLRYARALAASAMGGLCVGSRKCTVLQRRCSILTAGKSWTMPKSGMTLTRTANGTSGNAARATAQQASLRARGGCSLLLGYACFCSQSPLAHAALLPTVRKATNQTYLLQTCPRITSKTKQCDCTIGRAKASTHEMDNLKSLVQRAHVATSGPLTANNVCNVAAGERTPGIGGTLRHSR